MADIYDMNAAIAKPNYLATLQQGIQFGNQQRQLKEQRADQNALRQLAPQIIAGDQAAYGQAAAIDPSAANAYQGAGDQQLNRLKGYIDYVEKARASGNPQALNAAVAAGSNFIGQITGKPGPTAWSDDPAFIQGWEGLKAKVAMLPNQTSASGVQSTYIDDQGQRVAIMRDGSMKVLGGADLGMSNQTVTVDVNGRPVQMTFNKRTGQYEQAGLAPQGMPSQTMPQAGNADAITAAIAQSANELIRQGVPQARVDAWAQEQAMINRPPNMGVTSPQGDMVAPPAANVPTGPFVGRTKEEEAAAVEQAKIDARQAAAPRQAELDAAREAAVTTARETAQGEAAQRFGTPEQRKAESAARAKVPQLNNAIRGVDRIADALAVLESGFIDTGPADQFVARYTKAGQELESAIGGIQNSILALTRVPGVGAQSDLEARVAALQYPSLDKYPEVNKRTIENLRLLMADLKAAYDNVLSGQAPVSESQAPENDGWTIEEVVE